MANKAQPVTKAELATRLAAVGISRRHARHVVDYFFNQVIDALRRGEVIHLVRFGAFRYKIRRARRGRNPKTGQAVQVPAKRVIHFRPSNGLKRLVMDT